MKISRAADGTVLEIIFDYLISNFHLHPRQGDLMKLMVRLLILGGWRGYLVSMPNLRNRPLIDGLTVMSYHNSLVSQSETWLKTLGLSPEWPIPSWIPTMQITPATRVEDIDEAHAAGVIAGKLYPWGVTYSEYGIRNFFESELLAVLTRMTELGMIKLCHGEDPDPLVPGMDKEKSFVEKILPSLIGQCGGRWVLEHVSTRAGLDFVKSCSVGEVGATIAVHYLYETHDDVIGYSEESGGLLRPHLHCKPTPKDPLDRDALIEDATSGDPHFWCGNDDAPHRKGTKECDGVCPGVFNTPAALSSIIDVFEGAEKLANLERFLCLSGPNFWGLSPLRRKTRVVRDQWIVPDSYELADVKDLVVPLRSGEVMNWKVRDQSRF